jgi:hypothetical protein
MNKSKVIIKRRDRQIGVQKKKKTVKMISIFTRVYIGLMNYTCFFVACKNFLESNLFK